MMRIFAFHLLNDFSGSPKVLKQLINGWVENKETVHLTTTTGRSGFLSDIPGVKYHGLTYRFFGNPLLRILMLFGSQVQLLLKLWFVVKKEDLIYINTVLPFGAAVLGKLKGCRIVYHIHETSVKPAMFKSFLFGIANWAADEAVHVSEYLANEEKFEKAKNLTLHNALENEFVKKVPQPLIKLTKPRNVLMVCSLKWYKGVDEFVALSRRNLPFKFRLVLNASQSEIDNYFKGKKIPKNLQVFATQTDLHPHYRWAHILLNLSRPDGWVETFGLTVIEAMAYGIPAIVPPVGGVTELVENGVNGYYVDSRDSELLNKRLRFLLGDEVLFQHMSQSALIKSQGFREDQFFDQSLKILRA